MSLKLNSSGGGSVTLQEPSTASNLTLTLPTTTGTAVIQNASNNLLMNSGYGSDAVAYGCRAWVNFNGTASSNLTGTYSQSGTTITITITNHGLIAGNGVYITFQSGAATAEAFTVVSVTNANVFVVTSATSRTTSGNCTANFNTIRGSGNVSSITDNGTGDYTVNFTTAMPDANYSAQICSMNNASNNFINSIYQNSALVGSVRMYVGTTGTLTDSAGVNVAIFR
jgi:hypothetical protein